LKGGIFMVINLNLIIIFWLLIALEPNLPT